MKIYNNYSDYLRNLYGRKVYKLPIAIPVTCPNRDGSIDSSGCTFCGEIGAGYENLPAEMGVEAQINQNKQHIIPKYKAEKFIAYLQNFSNTYLPLTELVKIVESCCQEDVVRVALSTRPDCISEEYLAALAEIREHKKIDISIELGLQTVNYKNLIKINRGHTLAEYLDAMQKLNQYNFYSCTHLILNLPNDDLQDVIESAKVVSALKSDEVKLHALYIIKNTEMARQYQAGEINLIGKDEYVRRVITFLEYLNPEITLQRLIGRAPASHTLFSNWGMGWWKIKEEIETIMQQEKTYQGRLFNYLDGRALNKFSR